MKIFSGATKQQTVAGPSVPLGDLDESTLRMLAAALYGFRQGISKEVSRHFEPVDAAVRAELTRRWQLRGGPIEVRFNERLPAETIELLARGLRCVADALRMSPEQKAAVEQGGPGVQGSVRGVIGAVEVLEKLALAVLDCKVALPAEG